MCTAITYQAHNHYFGRNLDLEYSYHEAVVVTPRNFSFRFCTEPAIAHHFGIIGMAVVVTDYPLYYDATNEYGLSMAGLNFPDHAVYHNHADGKVNITPYELIPWILSQCKTVSEALAKLEKINLLNHQFSAEYPLTPLHWILADRHASYVIEPMVDGIHVYENPVGVLTNNPPFPYHLYHLREYLNITAAEPINRFSNKLDLHPFSRGMGAIGMPGDLSSTSRFVRGAFIKLNALCEDNELPTVSQFFHILSGVEQQRGCAKVGENYEITIYSSCCNTDLGIYYYKTYENSQITAVNMHHCDLDSNQLISFPLRTQQSVYAEN